MTQSSVSQYVTPEASGDALQPPVVLPVRKPAVTRHVGVVRSYSPPKSLGLVIDEAGAENAIFRIEDVAPADRGSLALGQSVSFQIVTEQDGLIAKYIRIDTTTLPPPPTDMLISRGWR